VTPPIVSPPPTSSYRLFFIILISILILIDIDIDIDIDTDTDTHIDIDIDIHYIDNIDIFISNLYQPFLP
jgi:hypothetical protein